MGLLSTLAHFHENDKEISGKTFGFLAYGSGSKSKVSKEHSASMERSHIQINLFETLKNSFEIDFETYEKFTKKEQNKSVRTPQNEWILDRIETLIPKLGARYYKWVD
jgi:hydroxymethylglutaryl-CoA synthase